MTRRDEKPDPTMDHAVDYERSDVHVKVVALSVAALAGIVVVAAIGMVGLFGVFRAWRADGIAAQSPLSTLRQPPPEPRLQVDPIAELAELRAYERDQLHTYRWVDRDQGVVAIPLERAIDLLIERDTLNRVDEGDDDASR